MISSQPSLKLSEYITAMVPSWGQFAQLGDSGTIFRYAMNGRVAIYQVLRSLGIRPGETILLPAFVSKSVLEAVEASGASSVFYDVQPDGRIDPSQVVDLIDEKTRVLLVIHYFGFPQKLTELSQVCHTKGVILLEDCAHAWLSKVGDHPAGATGDVAIYSIRKFLPMIDGGALRLNTPLAKRLQLKPLHKQPLLRWIKVQKELIDQVDLFQNGLITGLLQGFSKAFQQTIKGQIVGNKFGLSSPNAYGIETEWADWMLSIMLQRIINLTNQEKVVQIRRENYCLLDEGIKQMPHVKSFFPTLLDGVCPWVYPFVPRRRLKFDQQLYEHGIHVHTFGSHIIEKGKIGQYPNSNILRKSILLLPCHQSLTHEQIEKILDALWRVKG